MNDKERVQAINDCFGGDSISGMLQLWEEDRTLLRSELVSMFQGDLKNQFTTFWSSGESKVKTALLVTALEEGTFGEMLPTLCPELLETEKLDSLVVPLIEKACSGRENLGTTFALESIQDVVQKPVADKCFKVMRSCLLLTFCWTTVQVYKNFTEEGEGTPEEGAEGAEEEGTKTDTQEEEH